MNPFLNQLINDRGSRKTVVLILVFFIFLFQGKTLLEKKEDTKAEILYRHNELAYQKGILAKKDDFLKKYEELQAQIGSQVKDSDEKINFLISELEINAKEEGLILNDVRPLPEEPSAGLKIVRVNIELEGELLNLTRFLHKILSRQEPLKIVHMALYQKIKGTQAISLDLELALPFTETHD